jgi:hypothetical protein
MVILQDFAVARAEATRVFVLCAAFPADFHARVFVSGFVVRARAAFKEMRSIEWQRSAYYSDERADFKMSYTGKEDSLAQKEC